jgi:Domain of unknown function (DUF4864)
MRFLRSVLFAAAAFGWTLPALAGADLPPGDRAAIAAAIQKQFDAFSRDDGDAAFAQAAPEIRQMFGEADTFMRMVKQSYAPVYRHREATFTDIKDGPTQVVTITGEDGRHWLAFYQMVLGEDGVWRIKGCNLIEDPDQHV